MKLAKVVIYSKANCAFCERAKMLLKTKKIPFEEIRVDTDPANLQAMQSKTNNRTLPQIFIFDKNIGGSDELHQLAQNGQLDELLKN